MAVEWFCQIMGSEVGPLNQEQLIDMVRQHQITPEDLIRRNRSPWVAAFEVKGLFEAAAKPPKPKPSPKPEPAAREGAAGQRATNSSSASATTSEANAQPVSQHDWFCIASGVKKGPLSFEQLQSLAEEGRLRGRDRVWRGSAPKWRKASEIPGLDTMERS